MNKYQLPTTEQIPEGYYWMLNPLRRIVYIFESNQISFIGNNRKMDLRDSFLEGVILEGPIKYQGALEQNE